MSNSLRLRVCIDARLALHRGRGWGRYAKELIPELAQAAPESAFHVLLPRVVAAGFQPENAFPNIDFHLTDFDPKDPSFFFEESVPESIRGYFSCDLFHSLTRFAPPMSNIPLVVTVHDLAPLHTPPYKLSHLQATLKSLEFLQESDATLIAISKFTQSELIRHDLEPERIQVIYSGVHRRFESPVSSFERDISAIERPYVLYVGGASDNKNIECLIEALDRGGFSQEFDLRIAGSPAWGYDNPVWRFRPWIRHLGFLSEDELLEVYRKAFCFVLPSRFEGFGLPVVEAMACGIPVICSDIQVFREIAHDAALFFDPSSVDSLVMCLQDLRSSPQIRERLIADGLRRSETFQWNSCALKTLETYQSVIEN